MKELCVALLLGVTTVVLMSGCQPSQEEGRPDVAAIPDEVHFADSVRGDIDLLEEALGPEGEGDIEEAASEFLENMEGYEEGAVGENLETYKAIYEGVQELAKMASDGAPKAQLQEKVDALKALGAKLPSSGGAAE